MGVRPLLGNRIQLVEKQHAPAGAGELEDTVEASRGLTEEARHDALVADDVEGQHELRGDGLGDTRLTVAGRSGQKNPIARLDPIAAQQVRALVFLDQLGEEAARHGS